YSFTCPLPGDITTGAGYNWMHWPVACPQSRFAKGESECDRLSMPLADRLNAARQRQFVGRTEELALFESALRAPDLAFHVLFVFGPGGIGKTTFARELVRLAEQAGIRAISIDARNL